MPLRGRGVWSAGGAGTPKACGPTPLARWLGLTPPGPGAKVGCSPYSWRLAGCSTSRSSRRPSSRWSIVAAAIRLNVEHQRLMSGGGGQKLATCRLIASSARSSWFAGSVGAVRARRRAAGSGPAWSPRWIWPALYVTLAARSAASSRRLGSGTRSSSMSSSKATSQKETAAASDRAGRGASARWAALIAARPGMCLALKNG